MGYLKTIDEYETQELTAELHRRQLCHEAGICDYCERGWAESPCKFSSRHKDKAIVYAAVVRDGVVSTARFLGVEDARERTTENLVENIASRVIDLVHNQNKLKRENEAATKVLAALKVLRDLGDDLH